MRRPSRGRTKGLFRQAKLLQGAHDERTPGQQVFEAWMSPRAAPHAHHGAVTGDLCRQILDLIERPASLHQEFPAGFVIDAKLALNAVSKGHAGLAKLAWRLGVDRRRVNAGRRRTYQGQRRSVRGPFAMEIPTTKTGFNEKRNCASASVLPRSNFAGEGNFPPPPPAKGRRTDAIPFCVCDGRTMGPARYLRRARRPGRQLIAEAFTWKAVQKPSGS
jgi:hypothetical protein